MPGVDVPRARRWFWALVGMAVLATGAVYWALGAPAGPLAATVLLVGGVVAVASTTQAARILRALNGPPDLDLGRRLEDADIRLKPGRRPRRSTRGART